MGHGVTRRLRFGAVVGKSRVEFDAVDNAADFGKNSAGWRRYNGGPGQLRQRPKGPVLEINQDQVPAVIARGFLCASSPGATHANANPDRCGLELQIPSRSDGQIPWLH